MQSLGGGGNPVLSSQFHRCRPEAPGNRQATRVRAPPPLETPVNLLHVEGNIGRLPGHRRSSLSPLGERPTLATTARSSHAGLPNAHVETTWSPWSPEVPLLPFLAIGPYM